MSSIVSRRGRCASGERSISHRPEAETMLDMNGFETGLIVDGHTWLKALESRNLTTHTYDEDTADRVESEIRISYYPLLRQLYIKLKDEI